MRFLGALVTFAVALIPTVCARNRSEIITVSYNTLSQCSLNCIAKAVLNSSCEVTDFLCLEQDKEIALGLKMCIATECSVREEFAVKNFTSWVLEEPVHDQRGIVLHTGLIAGVFAILAVTLRIFARLPCCGGVWGLDDWMVMLAMLTVLPLTALTAILANQGLGKDVWTVPFDNITGILKAFYWGELLYLSAIALIKISILLFYLRIFPNRNFRRYVKLTIAVCVLFMVAFVPAVALQCLPISLSWTRWDKLHPGKCINLHMIGWVRAATNMFLNIAIICLPLGELSKLAMGRFKKAGIMVMFLMGGFETVVSALRLKWMVQFANSRNPTWDYTPIGYFSTLEVHVGIILACLPAIRMLQRRLFPSTKPSTNYYIEKSAAYGRKSKSTTTFCPRRHSIIGIPESQICMTRSASRDGISKSRPSSTLARLDEDKALLVETLPTDREKGDIEIIGRGVNSTHIERGSIHSVNTWIQAPPPAHLRIGGARRHSHDSIVPLQAHIITVRKAFTVTRSTDNDEMMTPEPLAFRPRSKSVSVGISVNEEQEAEREERRKKDLERLSREFRCLSDKRVQVPEQKPMPVQKPESVPEKEERRKSEDGDDGGFWG